MNYSERLRQVLNEGGDRPTMQWSGSWWSWQAFNTGVQAIDAAIETAGAGGVPAAAVVLRNRPGCVSALLALGAARRTTIMVSPIQPVPALCADMLRLRPDLVIVETMDWTPELQQVVATLGAAAVEIVTDGQALSAVARATLRGGDREKRTDSFPDAGIVIPTSGTTGPPKRIPLSWSHLDEFVPRDGALNWEKARPVIVAAPLVTITGLRPTLTWATRPLKLALLERLDLKAWAELVREHKPKIAGLPPAAMHMMLDSDIPAEALASLDGWYTGSAPLDPDVAEAFERRFKLPVIVAYGATEFGGPVAGWSVADRKQFAASKRGSTGRFYDDCAGRIVDPETGETLPPNTPGLLEVKSPKALTQTKDGWLRTNDLARIDEDGFLFILGRADDVIIRGGFKVPLFEVERALTEHPAVQQAAGVGLPDERLGEVPAVAVILDAKEKRPSEEELQAWVRERLAPYKVPVLILAVDEFPATASMKVARTVLREQLAAERAKRAS